MKVVKSLAVTFDKRFLSGSMARFYSTNVVEGKLRNHRAEFYGFGIDIEYKKNSNSLLNTLCDKYGSDKGEVTEEGNPYTWPSHSYADFYELLFQIRRNDVNLVLECGLGTNNPALASSMGADGRPGASLRVWRDYFPNAQIIGIDIDENILFEEERIRTFVCDQTSSESIEKFIDAADIKDAAVDIIIDDGLHEFEAAVSLFEGLIKCLSDDGIYVIEDVGASDYRKYKSYYEDIASAFTARFVNLRRPGLPIGDNRLIVITRSA